MQRSWNHSFLDLEKRKVELKNMSNFGKCSQDSTKKDLSSSTGNNAKLLPLAATVELRASQRHRAQLNF